MSKNIHLEDRTNTLDRTNLGINNPKYIIMHSTNSYPEFEDLLKKHKYQNKWKGVGYHLFLSDSNRVYSCRPFNLEGEHAWGFNLNSVGFCIYTHNEKINREKIRIGKEVLTYLRKELREIPLISHSLAQVIYFNKLLKENGFEKQFPEDQKIINKKFFSEVKSEMDSFISGLSTSKYSKLKDGFKSFRNCPGELFNHFI